MIFHVVTILPEFFASFTACGLMGKAADSGLVELRTVNPRDFARDRHRSVDDRPYGGGPGMVMLPETLAGALRGIESPGRMLLLSPKGRPLTQDLIRELAEEPALTLVCGRYEGIDARLEELFPLEPVSVGDYVLNGGEAGAACLMEAVARLLPEFMGHADSGAEESFSSGLLEYPHYTRPEVFEGLPVPKVLTGGDHGRIAAWRREQALRATLDRRPDLLPEADLEEADLDFLRALPRLRPGRNLHLALVHYPVLNRQGDTVAVSLTNLDLHDMSRVSRTYGLGGMYAVTPLEDQRRIAETVLGHWTEGPGSRSNPDRAEALAGVKVCASLEEAVLDLEARLGQKPFVAATSAQGAGALTPGRLRQLLAGRPVLLVFGTGNGLAPDALGLAHGLMRPLRCLDGYNHLSVRSAVSILVDRILGDAG